MGDLDLWGNILEYGGFYGVDKEQLTQRIEKYYPEISYRKCVYQRFYREFSIKSKYGQLIRYIRNEGIVYELSDTWTEDEGYIYILTLSRVTDTLLRVVYEVMEGVVFNVNSIYVSSKSLGLDINPYGIEDAIDIQNEVASQFYDFIVFDRCYGYYMDRYKSIIRINQIDRLNEHVVVGEALQTNITLIPVEESVDSDLIKYISVNILGKELYGETATYLSDRVVESISDNEINPKGLDWIQLLDKVDLTLILSQSIERFGLYKRTMDTLAYNLYNTVLRQSSVTIYHIQDMIKIEGTFNGFIPNYVTMNTDGDIIVDGIDSRQFMIDLHNSIILDKI